MGSINNCSFVLPRINEIAQSLRALRDDPEVAMISLSSVGPGFFAITTAPKKIEKLFTSLNMKTLTTLVHNDTYSTERK
jgi:shikimate kinase